MELVQTLSEGISVSVGQIDKPWASDATVAAVATQYRVEGDALIQSITPTDGATYPIVADPSLSFEKNLLDAEPEGAALGR